LGVTVSYARHQFPTRRWSIATRVPVAAKANRHLAKVEPFKTVLTGDFEKVANLSLRKLDVIPAATLTGMDVDAFQTDVKSWLDSAKHPR
jgi:hypothetical protein